MSVDVDRTRHRTLTTAAGSTLLVLAVFVTPLGTGVRTAADFGAGPGAQAWLLSSMSVGLAAALLTAGVLADDLGRRRVLVAGLALVAAGAAVAGLAAGTVPFVVGRLVQGVGGAAVLAGALGVIGQVFPPGPDRARAAAVWGASVGAGTGLGGVATVLLDHGTQWRVTYLVTAVVGTGVALVAHRTLPGAVPAPRRRPDVAGAVLLAAGLSALLAGLVQSRSGSGTGVVLLVVGVLLLAAFVVVERRSPAPMVDLALFRSPGFRAATLGALLTGGVMVGLASYLPSMVQRGLGSSLLAATLLVLFWSAVSTATAVAVRWLPGVDGRLLLAGALAVAGLGMAALAVVGTGSSPAVLLPGLLVFGVGYGAANAALGREAVAHVPPARAGMGSGANNTARYVGAALGTTVVVLVASSAGPA
ncbi:MFS transporter, partial [Klenkia sp. PcliD-1-E]|uniref:MFS transporter n=1 Tax=Klenkia sp. PcliD-1-E TaxID=2954492 RepID=UPI002096F224